MTLFHFGNCLALAYVPYWIVYRSSGLSEYSAFWKCVQAGAAYLFTQLCKMLLLATFFPATESASSSLDVLGETLKCTVDLADLIGLHLCMTQIAGKGQLKFMIAGMGWATAELVMTRCLPLWFGARGVEFDWKYIQMCFESNVNLVQHISTAALVWLYSRHDWNMETLYNLLLLGEKNFLQVQHISTAALVWLYSRHDLNKSLLPVILSILALGCYRPLIVEILTHAIGLGSWALLLAKTMFTSCVGLVSLRMFLSLQQTANSY